jgi:hypothetical protein
VDHTKLRGFYELYPNETSPQLLFPVSAGDSIYATCSLDSGSGLWYILVEDMRTSTYFANEFSFTPDRSTAEWITEALNGFQSPNLSPAVSYTQATWAYAFSPSLPLTSSYVGTLWIDKQSNELRGPAYCPSGIGGDGESFTVQDC